jgi:hypothetical protein
VEPEALVDVAYGLHIDAIWVTDNLCPKLCGGTFYLHPVLIV